MTLWPVQQPEVGPIGPEAADAVAEIHGEAFDRAWSAHDFANLMAEDTVLALGAWRQQPFGEKRLVGFALLRQAADEAEVLTIAVRPGAQGRGLGRRMMEDALRRLYGERVKSCFLEVDRGNAPALRLYRGLGFAEAGERRGYYADGGSALVMRVALAGAR